MRLCGFRWNETRSFNPGGEEYSHCISSFDVGGEYLRAVGSAVMIPRGSESGYDLSQCFCFQDALAIFESLPILEIAANWANQCFIPIAASASIAVCRSRINLSAIKDP